MIIDLSTIKLVTFDIFGTVLNWQRYVEQFFPGRYAEFLAASERRQQCDLPMLPYQRLLEDVYIELRGDQSHAEARQFAANFGQCPAFADSHAIAEISDLLLVGCLSNSDAFHQLSVQRQLRVHWDFVLLSEQLKIYKPSAKFWKHAVERVQEEYSIAPSQWLHMSAFLSYDLKDARECGVLTGFVPRPGGSSAVDAEAFAPDVLVSDLAQLHEGLVQAKSRPQLLTVTLQCAHSRLVRELIRWFRHDGCEVFGRRCRFEVTQSTPERLTVRVWGSAAEPLDVDSVKRSFQQSMEQRFPVHLIEQTLSTESLCLRSD
jgi:FMN phosphatase YigB (HAD superfamily)